MTSAIPNSQLHHQNSGFSTLNYGGQPGDAVRLYVDKAAEEAVMLLRQYEASNIPIIEMHVIDIKAVLRRLFGWEDVIFESIPTVLSRFKIEGSGCYMLPRISLSLDSIDTKADQINARAMANAGLTTYSESKVQPVARENRFVPVELGFKISYFYSDYPTAVKFAQNFAMLSGLRQLRYNTMGSNFDHHSVMMFGTNIPLVGIETADKGPVSMMALPFTIQTTFATVNSRPVMSDESSLLAHGLITEIGTPGDIVSSKADSRPLTPAAAWDNLLKSTKG